MYEILGVGHDADDEQIRSAYRRLVRTTHPDAGGSNALFVLVQEAYETLSDPVKRVDYDGSRDALPTGGVGEPDGYEGWEEVVAEEEPRRPHRSRRALRQSEPLPLAFTLLLGAVLVGITGWLASGVDHWLAWQVDQGIPHAIGMIHGPVPALPGPSFGVVFWAVIGGGVGTLLSEKVVQQLESRRRVHTVELGVLAIFALWQTAIALVAWALVIGLVVLIVRFGGRRRQIEAHQ